MPEDMVSILSTWDIKLCSESQSHLKVMGLVGSRFHHPSQPAAPSNPKTNISPDATNAARNAVLRRVHTVGEFPDFVFIKT